MTLGNLTSEFTPDGKALSGHVRLDGENLRLLLTETPGSTPLKAPSKHPEAPAYHVHALCDCCDATDRVGAAWWKQARKHGGRFLLIVLNEGGMSRRFTLIAKPDGKGGFVVEPRRPRAQPSRKKAV